ncbi:MAG: hypothetical protein QXX99_06210 [Candidatus Bathyarchaeia archaeon]
MRIGLVLMLIGLSLMLISFAAATPPPAADEGGLRAVEAALKRLAPRRSERQTTSTMLLNFSLFILISHL